MKQNHRKLFLSLTVGSALLATAALAQTGPADNRIRDRAEPSVGNFTNIDHTMKMLSVSAGAPTFKFSPTLEVGPGYATNPDQAPQSSGAYFLGATLSLDAALANTANNTVFAGGYDVTGTFYERNADSNNEVDHVLYTSWQQKLGSRVQYKMSVSDTQVEVDSSALLNVAAATADLRGVLNERTDGGVAFTYQVRRAHGAADGRSNPDSVRLIPTAYIVANLSSWTGVANLPELTLGYSYYWNLADGADQDFHSSKISASATAWKFSESVAAEIDASYEDRQGDNLNSALASLARRNDQITKLGVNLTAALDKGQKLSTIVGFERARSGLAAANYRGWTFAATWAKTF